MLSQICVFDAYGTLFQVASDTLEIKEAFGDESVAIQTLWRNRQLEYTWLRSLMGKWVSFDAITENALDFALDVFGVTEERKRKLLLDIFYAPTLFNDVIPFMERMKLEGKSLAIASNGTKKLLKNSAKETEIYSYLDFIISADDAHIFKPSPKYYSLITSQFKCQPNEITFFSSNAWDIAGAAHFGFNTVWINRKNATFEQLGVKPNLEVSGLNE